MATVDVVTQVINLVGTNMHAALGQLQPVGEGVLASSLVLLILAGGVSLMHGSVFMPQIVRMTLVGAAFGFAISTWQTIVDGMVGACDQIVALLLPGWTGPTSAFQLTSEVAQRMAAAWPAYEGVVASITNGVYLAIATVIVSICLTLVSASVLVAKVILMVGAALAPLLLCLGPIPGIGLDIALGPVRFLLRGCLTYIATASVAALIIQGVTQSISVGGVDVSLTTDQSQQLVVLSLVGAVLAMVAGSLGGMLLSGSFGGSGVSNIVHASNTTTGIVSSAASGAMNAAPGIGSAAGAVGGMARAAGSVTTRASGSAFGA